MSTIVHFIDVGQGNMSLIQCADGANFVMDCNVTEDNKERVLDYVGAQIGSSGRLSAFICSHRDADHIRGVKTLHSRFRIGAIWDSGYPGTTTDSAEYEDYMELRRSIGSLIIDKQKYQDFGRTRFRYMSAKDDRLPGESNDQGIVVKIEHRSNDAATVLGSTIVPGDSSALTWKDGILKDYSDSDVSCDIFLAAHHGSISFFDDRSDSHGYYERHIKVIAPDMVVISVGENSYGHPDPDAVALYRKHTSGSDKGNKVVRTDKRGTMKLTLPDAGGWKLS